MTTLHAVALYAFILAGMWVLLTVARLVLDVWPHARAAAVRLWDRRRFRRLLGETERHVARQERAHRGDVEQARRLQHAAAVRRITAEAGVAE